MFSGHTYNGAMRMENPPNQPDTSPVASRIDFDVPCPKCEYNLRGLTVPRCPECGEEFDWEEITRPPRKDANTREGVLWTAIAVVTFMMLAPALTAGELYLELILLPFIICAPFAIVGLLAAVQAGVEIGFASLAIGAPTWRRFRAWWEGVLIGYGACSLLAWPWGGCLNAPTKVAYAIQFSGHSVWRMWPLFLSTGLAFLVVQWWVVRRRTRQWNDPIPDRRLWLGCLLAKLVAAVAWVTIAWHGS